MYDLPEYSVQPSPRWVRAYVNGQLVAGRNTEAVAVLKRALIRNPDLQVAQRFLTVAYMETGRVTEAQAEIAKLLRTNSNFSLETARHTWPCADPVAVERYVSALSNAGLT